MFWITSTTAKEMFGETYHAWELFGPVHLFWIGLTVLCTYLVWKYVPKMSKEQVHRLFYILTLLMIADELFKDIPNLVTGQFEWECLPFHLCSVNIFVAAIHTYKESEFTKAILTCVCVPAAFCALFMPTWTCLPMWNFIHLHSETVHIMLFVFPMIILAQGYRPSKKSIPLLVTYLVLLACLDKVINYFLGTNFLFLTHNENNPALIFIENVFGRFYNVGIIAGIVVLSILMIGLWSLIKVKKA